MAGFSPLCLGEGPEERLIPQNAGKPKANEGGKKLCPIHPNFPPFAVKAQLCYLLKTKQAKS